jgi:hypothetical protein
MITATATADPRLTWGPRAGTALRVLGASDEGRGHLRWLLFHAETPPEDRAAVQAFLQASPRLLPPPDRSAPIRLRPRR